MMNAIPVPAAEYEREARPPPPSRLKLIPFDNIRLGRQRRYLVKGIVPRVGMTIAWGPPKCGKSFWVFDMAMHVALGWEYRNRRVHRGGVVYCAFEGQEGFEARVEAFRQRFLQDAADPVPFFLEPVTIDLVGEHKELIATIRRQVTDAPPVLVVLDTLNRSMRGSESSDEDMTAYIRAADAIRVAFNCAVVIVHHCGIDGTRPRGHTSLTGAVDAQLSVKRDAAENIVVTVECAKDGPEGDVILSKLERVEVGIDEDGDEITSCIVVPAEASAATRPTTRLSKNQQSMLDILRDAGPSGMAVDAWNAAAREQGIGASRKADLYDIRRALQKLGLIAEGQRGWFVRGD